MLMVLLKTLIIYAYLLLIMRLMGKREVGQLQTFELVVSMIIADVAAVPIYDEKASLLNVIISVGTLFLLHVIIAIINLKSVKGREILCGRPRILIEKGKIDEEALQNLQFEDVTVNYDGVKYIVDLTYLQFFTKDRCRIELFKEVDGITILAPKARVYSETM